MAKKKGLSSTVIKYGLAKDEKGAQVVLLIIAVVAILIGGFFFFGGGGASEGDAPNTLPEGQFIP